GGRGGQDLVPSRRIAAVRQEHPQGGDQTQRQDQSGKNAVPEIASVLHSAPPLKLGIDEALKASRGHRRQAQAEEGGGQKEADALGGGPASGPQPLRRGGNYGQGGRGPHSQGQPLGRRHQLQ